MYFVLGWSDSGNEEGEHRSKAEDGRDGGDEAWNGDEEDGIPGDEERLVRK